MTPYLTVAMPAYNEADNLPRNVPRLVAKLDELQPSFEIVIVNDCSRDATGQIAEDLARAEPRVRVVHHAVNQGIGQGFVSAVKAARGEYLILIPADLALDLDELHKFLDAASVADVVVGRRSSRSDYNLFRKLVSVVNIGLIQVLFRMPQKQFNYISLYRTRLLKAMAIEYTGSAFFHAETLIKARDMGGKLVEVDIEYVPREGGRPTGANRRQITRTVRDIFHYWARRTLGRA